MCAGKGSNDPWVSDGTPGGVPNLARATNVVRLFDPDGRFEWDKERWGHIEEASVRRVRVFLALTATGI